MQARQWLFVAVKYESPIQFGNVYRSEIGIDKFQLVQSNHNNTHHSQSPQIETTIQLANCNEGSKKCKIEFESRRIKDAPSFWSFSVNSCSRARSIMSAKLLGLESETLDSVALASSTRSNSVGLIASEEEGSNSSSRRRREWKRRSTTGTDTVPLNIATAAQQAVVVRTAVTVRRR